jgi:deoxyadenosine/deoxycytidine kinase
VLLVLLLAAVRMAPQADHLSRYRVSSQQTQNVVYDRTFYEDPAFAGMLNHMGFIDDDSLETYMELAWTMFTNGTFRVPDVVIVLDVKPEICLERIQKRGREMEKKIDLNFLKMLAFYYGQMMNVLSNLIILLLPPL